MPVTGRNRPGVHAELRPYQQDGFSWLAYLWRHRLGGILADDMGLGKTLQCLALMQHVAEHSTGSGSRSWWWLRRRSWRTGCPRRSDSPRARVRTVSATEARAGSTIAEAAAGADMVVTSYALLRLDFDAYQTVAGSSGWAGLVLDEAQFVKNPASKVHAARPRPRRRFKLAVTGTPLENSLTDLQALFAIVAPGLFASAPRFLNDYVRPIEQSRPGIARGVGAGNAVAVNAAVRADSWRNCGAASGRSCCAARRNWSQLISRRSRSRTARRTRPGAPRDLYELFLQRERQKLFRLLGDDMDLNKFIVFRSLTLLRLLALDASLIGEEYAGIAVEQTGCTVRATR